MKRFLNAGFMLLAAGSMTADTLPFPGDLTTYG